jgi:muramoyltetrapeptide carboxypeptidase
VAGTGGNGFLSEQVRVSRPLLKRGDRVGVVATGFAARPEALDAGVRFLARRGLEPVPGVSLRAIDGYFAGDDAARALDLDAAIADRSIDAVWFARGGYGTARILDRVDLARLVRRPKLLLGYSDLTALFGALLSRAATVCLHAPVVAELGTPKAFHAPSLTAALAGRRTTWRIRRASVLEPGAARGRLMGGNLTVLCHLLGTPHMPDLRGSVLFLEEIGEEAYRVDRLLQHLRMSGALRDVRAIVLGQLYVPKTARTFPGDRDLSAVLRDHLIPLGVADRARLPGGPRTGEMDAASGRHGFARHQVRSAQLRSASGAAPQPQRLRRWSGGSASTSPTTAPTSRAGSSSPDNAPCRASSRRRSRAFKADSWLAFVGPGEPTAGRTRAVRSPMR